MPSVLHLVKKGTGKPVNIKVTKLKYAKRKTGKRAKKKNRSGQDILSIPSGLTPNSIDITMPYRDSINFTSMGSNQGGGAVSPCLMRFLLNDPSFGVGADRLGSVMIQTNTNTPIFVHENPNLNLTTELNDYYNEYFNAVVTSSKIKVNMRFKPNQKGVGQYFVNSAQPSGDTVIQMEEADKVGDGLFWAVSQKNAGTLNTQNPTLWELKREIPGVVMKRMTLSQNGVASKGIQFSASYSPARSAGIKDWQDNIEEFNFSTTDRTNKPRYLYVGCTSQQQPLLATANLASVYLDYQIEYKIKFFNRKNIYGNNNPIPRHAGEF